MSIGGLIGYSRNSTYNRNTADVKNCYTTVEIIADCGVSKTAYAGGLAAAASDTTFMNCFATGNITSTTSMNTPSFFGGIIGYCSNTTISGCYALNTQEIKVSDTVITGTKVGYTATLNKLNDKEFYTLYLAWDENIWNLNDLNAGEGKYPTFISKTK